MVGEVPTKHALGKLIEYGFIDGFEPTPLGRAITEHFLEPSEAFMILDAIRSGDSPDELVAEMALRDEH